MGGSASNIVKAVVAPVAAVATKTFQIVGGKVLDKVTGADKLEKEAKKTNDLIAQQNAANAAQQDELKKADEATKTKEREIAIGNLNRAQARLRARAGSAAGGGVRSTILTSPLGLSGDAGAVRTLLGS